MRVEKVMTSDVKSCRPGDTMAAAAKIMWEYDCGCVPVVTESKVIGMITDRDICMAAYTQGRRLDEVSIGEVMSHAVVTCSPTDEIEEAEALMQKYQLRRLPVVSNGKLLGILSLNDIALATPSDKVSRTAREGVPSDELAKTLASISTHRKHRQQGRA